MLMGGGGAISYDSDNFLNSRIVWSWIWKKRSDSVSDTVSIYVTFRNNRPQSREIVSSIMSKKLLVRAGPSIS